MREGRSGDLDRGCGVSKSGLVADGTALEEISQMPYLRYNLPYCTGNKQRKRKSKSKVIYHLTSSSS